MFTTVHKRYVTVNRSENMTKLTMTTTPLWRLFLVITATAAAAATATTALAAITRYTVAIGALYAANRATNLFQAISTIYYYFPSKNLISTN